MLCTLICFRNDRETLRTLLVPCAVLATWKRRSRGGRAGARGGARGVRARGPRRASGPGAAPARDPAVRLAIEMSHRASMPGNAGGKQVAIVQPQRRDTNDQIDNNPPRSPLPGNKRARSSKSDADTSVNDTEADKTVRKSSARASPKSPVSNLQNTTKATLWIESRKPSARKTTPKQPSPKQATPRQAALRQSTLRQATPRQATPRQATPRQTTPRQATPRQATPKQMTPRRAGKAASTGKKSTPLRLTVLRRAQSASKHRVDKIEGPLVLGEYIHVRSSQTKTRIHSKFAPFGGVLKFNEVGKYYSAAYVPDVTKQAALRLMTRQAPRPAPSSTTIIELTDSEGRNSSLRASNVSRRSGKSPKKSPAAGSPRKSALKDPSAKRGTRKTESIKFDLSNLENHSEDTDVMMVSDLSSQSCHSASSSLALHYSAGSPSSPASPAPPGRASSRGARLVQRALQQSPASPRPGLESYSIVDLVSIDSNESARSASVYGSPASTDVTTFETPQNTTGRRTRSTIDATLLGSSTPYVKGRPSTPKSRSNASVDVSSRPSMTTQSTLRSSRSRRSKSLSTPENSEEAKKHISVNSTRISRAARSRSRLHDTADSADSTRSVHSTHSAHSTYSVHSTHSADSRTSRSSRSVRSPGRDGGLSTPENVHSPEEASTPVLSIQSLLDSSTSFIAHKSTRKIRPSFNTKRKTIGGLPSRTRTRADAKFKSLSFNTGKARLSDDSVEILNNKDDSEIVTPKSAVKLVQEAVKNKHSTAKKPQSKRSIIDDLNESDIVKQLFNSPVKRKLSQSMTEFSRKQSLDEDEPRSRRPARLTAPAAARTPDQSLLDHTDSYTPEIFVSPISTPTRSPSLDGIKLMFAKTTPENDLRNVKGVKALLRTPRTRRSIKNDLRNVSGVKNIFAKSPKNRLSDVRVKEVFASSPKNDLRRVTGVKSLFQTSKKRKSPRNELDDVVGVKRIFKNTSPANDLRNVSGVRRVLRRNSPRNELENLHGVKRMFARDARDDLNDVSGVEELFNLSNLSVSTRAESLFDQLVGKPQIKVVYSKTFSKKTPVKTKTYKTKSLHASLEQVPSTDDWLQQELNKRQQVKSYLESLNSSVNRSKTRKSKSIHTSLDRVTNVDVLLDQELNKEQQINNYLESIRSVDDSQANKSKRNQSAASEKAYAATANVTRELQKLMTETVEGHTPLCTSRTRNSSLAAGDSSQRKSASQLYSARKLPIKKRSLAGAAGPQAAADAVSLPLKKRGVQHSTPLKGRAPTAPRAPHSPIAPTAAAAALPASLPASPRGSPQRHRSTKSKETAEVTLEKAKETKAQRETEIVSEHIKPSPRKTRGRGKAVSSKAKPKASPARKKAATTVDKAHTGLAVLTKEKNSPKVGSPIRKTRQTRNKQASPVKQLFSPEPTTRSRKKDVSTRESNAKQRAPRLTVAKKSLVKSPPASQRASRKRKEPETSSTPKPSPKKTRAARNNASIKDVKPKTPKSTRAKVQKASVVVSKPSPSLKPRPARSEQETTRKSRRTGTVHPPLESHKKSQASRKTQVESTPNKPTRRNTTNKTKDKNVVDKPDVTTKTSKPTPRKTRNNKQEKSIEQPKTVKGRGKKVLPQESVQSETKSRGRRATKPEPEPQVQEVKTRKRKLAAPDNDIPPKVRKSKVSDKNTGTSRKKSATTQPSIEKAGATRARNTAAAEPAPSGLSTRRRKANQENIPDNQITGKRKRPTAAESLPSEGAGGTVRYIL
ncbi:hypothetical protein SFRURICE_007548 [Spodoptera frugiperda]|nr:hypothetical protein SFRURICE_007548 [Spodoptera frugiperda]